MPVLQMSLPVSARDHSRADRIFIFWHSGILSEANALRLSKYIAGRFAPLSVTKGKEKSNGGNPTAKSDARFAVRKNA